MRRNGQSENRRAGDRGTTSAFAQEPRRAAVSTSSSRVSCRTRACQNGCQRRGYPDGILRRSDDARPRFSFRTV